MSRDFEITSRAAAYERGEPMAAMPSPKLDDIHWQVLVGAEPDGALRTPYRYLTEKPADDWIKENFDDRTWQIGRAPFGNRDKASTPWKSPEIYLRKSFEYDGGAVKNGAVVIRHNDNTEIYINGEKIVGVTGSKGYYLIMATEAMNKALKKGTNTLAVHSHEGGEGQFIDLAILAE